MTGNLDEIEILHPQEPHCATVLLLDTSASMGEDKKIDQLNEGLKIFKDDISKDDLARKRVDLAIVTFDDDARIVRDFSPISEFEPPTLEAHGTTSMGKGILMSIEIIRQRKLIYNKIGVDYFRPWIFMITDGGPTDMSPGTGLWNSVTQELQLGETNKNFSFFAIGVDPANIKVLKGLSPKNREPLRLRTGHFAELFEWLSKSQGDMCKPGDQIILPSPTGWGIVGK